MSCRIAAWLSRLHVIMALRQLDSALAAAVLARHARSLGSKAEVCLVAGDALDGVAVGNVVLIDLHPILGFSVAAPCLLVTTMFGLNGVYALPGLQALYEPKPRASTTTELVARFLGVAVPVEVNRLKELEKSPLRLSEYYYIVEKTVEYGVKECIEALAKKARLLPSKAHGEAEEKAES